MGNSQVAEDAENVKEKASSNRDSTMKESTDPEEPPFLPKWRKSFIFSCLFAVLTDPLFLYVPLINDDVKCMRLDTNLKIAALGFRSVTDIFYIVNIILQVYNPNKYSLTLWTSYIIIDVLAVLPLPQVVILIFFPKMRGVGSLNTIKGQYVPRLLRIYILCKEHTKSSKVEIATWVKGVLYFVVYILAGHVFGASWYFFSVQRIKSCWQHACHIENGCKPSNFDCHDCHSLRNPTLLNTLCPVDPPNAKLFDFGIFLDALQADILGSKDYPKKILSCFWWGLRNMSSFGSNLHTSTETWESLFATLISIIGLLLFIYLIGNLQIYMGSETANKEQEKWTREVEWKRKIELGRKISRKLDSWLLKNDLPSQFKSEIMEEMVNLAMERNKDDVDVDDMLISNLSHKLRDKMNTDMDEKKIDSWLEKNGLRFREDLKSKIMGVVHEKRQESEKFVLDPNNILPILPPNLRSEIVEIIYVPLDRLRQVRLLENVNDQMLKRLSEKLRHKRYTKGRTIIYEEKPLKRILFIVDGVVSIEKRYCLTRWELKAGDIYGEELHSLDQLPPATESVKTKSDTEVLILEAKDLRSVVSNVKLHNTISSKYGMDHLPMLTKVPELEKMDEEVLKAISAVLKPNRCAYGKKIIKENNELNMMFFVTRGTVQVTKSGTTRKQLYKDGKPYGTELLVWAMMDYDKPEMSPLPSSAGTATVNSKDADVLILECMDLYNIFQYAATLL